MKQLKVNKIDAGTPQAADVPAIMDRAAIAFNAIDTVNWAEWSYRPTVAFRIAHTGDNLLLHYVVDEEAVRAVAPEDNGRVWEDSCVECFVTPADDATYYNIECNCAGTLLVGGGPARTDRRRADARTTNGVDRWASLGRQPFDTINSPTTWQVALVVPRTTFFMHNVEKFDGQVMRANFYKCGDLLPRPHFLSWNAIDRPKPDFHCPDNFGLLRFV